MNALTHLSNDQIARLAPSVFADAPHVSRSEKYQFIPTVRVLDAMRDNGFMPVRVSQSRTRIEGKAPFTKHMIAFRRATDTAVRALGDTSAEIVMVNSHDGTSSYHLMAGLFRLVCLNGMVAKMGDIGEIRVPHSGKIIDRVIEGSFRVIDQSTAAIETAARWQGITLDNDESLAFARAAARLRWDGERQQVNPASIIAARRPGDVGNDLWNTFNRAQESLIRGGLRVRSLNPDTQAARRSTAREVGSIDKNVGLNQALWTLADEMAKLKAA